MTTSQHRSLTTAERIEELVFEAERQAKKYSDQYDNPEEDHRVIEKNGAEARQVLTNLPETLFDLISPYLQDQLEGQTFFEAVDLVKEMHEFYTRTTH